MSYCPNCGFQLYKGASFCSSCGTPLKKTDTAISAQNQRNPKSAVKSSVGVKQLRWRRTVTILLILTAVLIIVDAAFIFYTISGGRLYPGNTGSIVLGETGSGGGRAVAAYVDKLFNDSGEHSQGSKIEDAIIENVSCEVTDSRGDGATVSVTAPDMAELVSRLSTSATDEENFGNLLYATLKNGDFQMQTVTLETAVDEDGRLVCGDELMDALYGGLFTAEDSLLAGGVQ